MGTPNPVVKFYQSVVDDVVNNVRESFLDENVDEQVLQELKQLWESKMRQSKAVDSTTKAEDNTINRHKHEQAAAAVHAAQQPTAVGISATGAAHLQPPQAVQMQSQLPIFNPPSGTLRLSGAAQAATVALPAGLYQQQMTALQDGRYLIQTTPQGTPQLIQLMPSQQLQQAQLQAAGRPITIPVSMVGQGEQPGERKSTTTQAVIQLDGALDSKCDDNDVTSVLTHHVDHKDSTPVWLVRQLDGAHDSSSDDDGDDDDDDDDDEDNDEDNENNENGNDGPEEDPLNSADDISEEDPTELFDSENVVVCQFEKINRSKNKWKFNLKDGIMNLKGKDYVFQKLTGDAEW